MNKKAFSLIELMIGLIIMSIMLLAFVPTLTKKSKTNTIVSIPNSKNIQVNNVPIGAIILWYGNNYPKGWIPLNGQNISDEKYTDLKNVIGQDILPDFNSVSQMQLPVMFIIKAYED